MIFSQMKSDLSSRLADVKTTEFREPELGLWINQGYVWICRRIGVIDRKDLLTKNITGFLSTPARWTLPADFGNEESFFFY